LRSRTPSQYPVTSFVYNKEVKRAASLHRMASDDDRPIDKVFKREQQRLDSVIRRRVLDPGDAEDVLQSPIAGSACPPRNESDSGSGCASVAGSTRSRVRVTRRETE
jgi:hypothetical protein